MNTPDQPATDTTPAVSFDAASGVLRLEGESYPEDVTAFYTPLYEWVRVFLKSRQPLVLQLAFTYLNTSSTKALLDLLLLLDENCREGHPIRVEWHYRKDVEIMQETGEEFAEDLSLPFQMVAVG